MVEPLKIVLTILYLYYCSNSLKIVISIFIFFLMFGIFSQQNSTNFHTSLFVLQFDFYKHLNKKKMKYTLHETVHKYFLCSVRDSKTAFYF